VEVVRSVVQELREKLAVDLDQTPDVDRWPTVETEQATVALHREYWWWGVATRPELEAPWSGWAQR
jgi:uncharacterized protein YlxP (DUF503 family)